MTAPAVNFTGDELSIRFDRFDADDTYELFKKCKALPESKIHFDQDSFVHTLTAPKRFAHLLGVNQSQDDQAGLPLSDFLFDDQRAITQMAINAKRFACWSDCGLGKTLIGLDFARQVIYRSGGRVLIVTLNEVVPQMLEMAQQFYGAKLPIIRLHSREEMKLWCKTGSIVPADVASERTHDNEPKIAIVNYEKFNHKSEADQVVNELRHLAGIWIDESSRLKTGGGKQKWALIKSARGIEFKLSTTATPAPNEIMEFASQASFLEKLRDQNEIIWTYFRRDEKTHRWTVKPHARKAFFEFMAGWSIYVRDPRRYGWRKDIPVPPVPLIFEHEIQMTAEQRQIVFDFNAAAPPPAGDRSGMAQMFAGEMNAISANKLSQAAKGFIYHTPAGARIRQTRRVESNKPQIVADLVKGEASDLGMRRQTLVWTVYDAETVIVADLLKDAGFTTAVITGKTPKHQRREIIEKFRHGEIRVLISRASMLGYGMNFQHCGSMVFSGWTFSYEAWYQAIRRAYRFGQKTKLRVHVPVIPELEGQMLDAIFRKAHQHEQAIAEMEEMYIRAMTDLHALPAREEKAA